MKRDEIEQLMAEYVNGKISPDNKLILEEIFKDDPALKQEADEMLVLWQLMDNRAVNGNKDNQFYGMLNDERQSINPTKVIRLNKAWFYATAAAACIIIFFAGRFTTAPVEVIKYKTLIVKQQIPAKAQPPIVQTTQPVIQKPFNKIRSKPHVEEEAPSALAQQLRSVYVSERLDAIAKLSTKKTLSKGELKLLKLALNEDPNPNVRLMVINSMRSLINVNGAQGVLIAGLNRQNNLLVQSLLVDVLVETKSKEAIPQMVALLDNKDTDLLVQNKIRSGIESFIN